MFSSSVSSFLRNNRNYHPESKRIYNDETNQIEKCCNFTITNLITIKTVVLAFCFLGGWLLLCNNMIVSKTTIGVPSIKANCSDNSLNSNASTLDAKHNIVISPRDNGVGVASSNSRLSALMTKLSLTNDSNDNRTNFAAEATTTFQQDRDVEREYLLNMSAVLDEAQIPPPHSPWHVLPSVWQTTTNSSSVSNLRRSMLHDMRRYIEEDGLPTKSTPMFRERLYLIRNGTLWKLSNQTLTNPVRWPQVEEMMQSALDIGSFILKWKRSLLSDHHYKFLQWLLGVEKSDDTTLSNTTATKSIPVLVNKEDFKDCAEIHRIPQFTYAMESSFFSQDKEEQSNNCIPFALPMYDMWMYLKQDKKFTPKDWYLNGRVHHLKGSRIHFEHFDLAKKNFPWDSKISKVLWRGSSTGGDSQKVESLRNVPRFQLVSLGQKFSNITDFGFVKLNQGWEKEPFKSKIVSQFGPLKPRMKFSDFMTYKAVLDINGNSWSSRFGHLMCFNSVIIKVETNDFVNYFEYPGGTDGSPELVPWHHYVPVKKNLSDLVEVSSYVLDPNNKEEMLAIVKNANQWCQHKMTVTQFAIDVLWMILNYVDLLYFYDPKQQRQQHDHQDFNTMDKHKNDDDVNQHEGSTEANNVDKNIAKIFDHQNPLNFEWIEQFVYQSREWEPAVEKQQSLFKSHF